MEVGLHQTLEDTMDKSARQRWHNMLVAAFADRELDSEEKAYLEEMRKDLGLSTEDANRIVAEFKAKRGGVELAGRREEKVQSLRDIIKVFLADGELDARERKMMVAVANHLQMDEYALKTLINDCRAEIKSGESDAPNDEAEEAPTSVQVAANTDPIGSEDLPPSTYKVSPALPAGAPEKRELPEVIGTIHEKTGIELIDIPEGTFYYGDPSVGGAQPEKECRRYRIARYAVTNEQWQRFEQETGYTGREDFGEKFNGARQPVVGVNLEDALAFCSWAGLRLPTEVEWERAARGTDARKFPWGMTYPDDDHANFGRSMFAEDQPRTVDVGSYPAGASPAGCYEMAGNVDEWCLNPDQKDERGAVTRSGNWLSGVYALNVYYRNFRQPLDRVYTVGFRVAADA